MQSDYWRREFIIALLSFGFGFFILPLAIYLVGRQVIGEYAPNAGLLDLAEHVWSDLFTLQSAAWVLVLSPYVVLQLVRIIRRLWRRDPV